MMARKALKEIFAAIIIHPSLYLSYKFANFY